MKSTGNCARKTGTSILCGIAALALQIPPVSAADYGVGVLFNGQDSMVVLPIRLESLTVEPELTLFRTSSSGQSSRFVTLSTGIYVRRELGPLFESYLGGRIGITSSKSPNSDTRAPFLAPTFGVQHFLSKQFSIGLDLGLQYARSDQDTTSGGTTTSTRVDNWATVTRILLRAYF